MSSSRMSWLRAWLAGTDPMVAVVGLASLFVYLLHGFDGALRRDLGVYVYGAERFLDGAPPYVGILNRAGPLAHMLPAVGIGVGRLLGIGDIRSSRIFFMLLSILCVCLVYLLARDLFGSRSGALVAAFGFLGFSGFLGFATYGPREKTAMVLFLLVALLAVRHRRWATAGVFVALGTLTWQPVFFVAVVTVAVAIVLSPAHRWRAALRVVLGGAVTTGIMLAYYLAEGALHDFLDGFLLINLRYTRQPGAAAAQTWRLLRDGYGDSLWLILIGLVTLPVLSLLAARTAWRSRDAAPVTLVALGAGWLAGVGWSFVAFNGYADLFVLLPAAALGLGGLATAGLRWAGARAGGRVTALVATAVAVALLAFAVRTSLAGRSDGLLQQRATVAAVLRRAPPGATIVSIQAPEALVIGGRTNPTRVQMFSSGFDRYVDDTWPGGLAGYVGWLERTRPDLIAIQQGFAPGWLTPMLTRDYRLVGASPRMAWWVSTEIPEPVRQSIHRAYRKAMAG